MKKKNVHPAPTMPPPKADPFNGEERQRRGYIVTAKEQETGERRTWQRTGKGSVQRIIEDLDDMEGDWKIICMSSPTTIFRDLQGTRDCEWMDGVQFPERSIMGRAGRIDLLDACFNPVTDEWAR